MRSPTVEIPKTVESTFAVRSPTTAETLLSNVATRAFSRVLGQKEVIAAPSAFYWHFSILNG